VKARDPYQEFLDAQKSEPGSDSKLRMAKNIPDADYDRGWRKVDSVFIKQHCANGDWIYDVPSMTYINTNTGQRVTREEMEDSKYD